MLILTCRNWLQRLSRSFPRGGRRPLPASRALRSRRPELERLEDRALPSVSVLQNFTDINYNQTGSINEYTPPDTMMAVGPTTVVGAVNTAIVLKDKLGNTLAGPEQFSTFFSSIHNASNGFSDPYVLYDDQVGRYYVGIIEYPSSATTGFFDFAVSNSSSPTGLNIGTGAGDWKVFSQISSVNEGGTEFPDFPKMGWNNDAVFVSFNQFAGGSTFSHDLVLAISKSSILAGGPLSTFQTDIATGSDINILIPARMHNETVGNLEYFVQATGGGAASTTVNVAAETGYLTGSPSFGATTITVNPYANSPGVPGLTGQIDDRILSADWVNNKLAAAQDVGVGGVNLARWYEFDTSATPALVPGQEGDVSPGAGVSTSYPSVAVNPNGDIGMTYIQSSNSQPFSMYVTGRLASDPAGAMQPAVEIAAGASPVPSALRGGDYSATEYDPANPSAFWSANEYMFDSSGSNFHWGTQIASYSLGAPPPPADLSVANTGPASSTDEGNNVTFTLTVTNTDSTNDATGVVLTDALGANLKFVSATTSQGTFTQSGGVITFTLGTVGHGQTVTATVTAQSTEDGSLTDRATVSSNNDPNPSNNSASANAVVTEPAIIVAAPITVTGKKANNVTAATFTHANAVEPASAFIAVIHWGDGTTSTGAITLSGTTYTVKGTHTYGGKPGSHVVTTTVTEAGSSPNIAAAGATIVAPSVVPGGTNIPVPPAHGAASGQPGLVGFAASGANAGTVASDLYFSLEAQLPADSGVWPWDGASILDSEIDPLSAAAK